jgi:hypothetical protein
MSSARRQSDECAGDNATEARERLRYYAAVEESLTRDTLRMAHAYAEKRCLVLSRLGLPREVEEIVADAIADTIEQRRPWKMEARPLASHLTRLIRSKTNDLIEHAARFRHTSIERMCACGDEGGADLTAPPPTRPDAKAMREDVVGQLVGAVLEAARGKNDQIVVGLIEAFRDGVTRRADVAEHLGIRPKQYDHARDRLARILATLPETLTADAVDVMRNWV